MSKRTYPLKWLDLLIERYDPAQVNSKENCLSLQGIDNLLSETERECEKIRLYIRQQFFQAANEKRARQVIRRCHMMITTHMNSLYDCKISQVAAKDAQHTLYTGILHQLEELLNYFECNFKAYLGEDRKVPKYYLNSVKKNMKEKVDVLRLRIRDVRCRHAMAVCTIVLDALDRFASSEKHHHRVTYTCLEYRRELLHKLELLPDWDCERETDESPIDRLLIYMNFNSKAYMDYLTQCFLGEINKAGEEPSRQMARLLEFYKEFRQLHSRPQQAFNPQYHSIGEFLDNWFIQEIEYRKNLQQESLTAPGLPDPIKKEKKAVEKPKVMCMLSSDQAALILRAADESRMLNARSMTEVFRSIVPHISTPNRQDLSYESVRIKSYSPEDKDKETVIHVLRRMIDKIQDY